MDLLKRKWTQFITDSVAPEATAPTRAVISRHTLYAIQSVSFERVVNNISF